ncbi:MAG: hypothetical protein MI919_20420 [Holophagales bacterium]|nr:hypothetical protein [Holophagales bacterium]
MTFFQLAQHLRDLQAASEADLGQGEPDEPVPRSAMLLNPTLAHGELGSRERGADHSAVMSPEPTARRAADFDDRHEDPDADDPGANDNSPADRAMA